MQRDSGRLVALEGLAKVFLYWGKHDCRAYRWIGLEKARVATNGIKQQPGRNGTAMKANTFKNEHDICFYGGGMKLGVKL